MRPFSLFLRPCRRTRRRSLCIAPAALAMIGAMTSCSGGSADDPPTGGAAGDSADELAADDAAHGDDVVPGDVAHAVTATRAVEAGRVELRITVSGPDGPLSLVHRAAFTDRGIRTEASSDMSEAAAVLADAGQQIDGDWSQPTRVIVDDDTVYSQLGPMAEVLGREPDDWVQARLADVSAAGADNDAMALALDPMGPLDVLSHPVKGIEEVDGSATTEVRGVPARHVRATLDLQAAEAAAPGSFEARLVAAGVDTLPVDVWLDDDGVVRRLSITVDAAGSLTTRFEVYDTGSDAGVEVTAPDPDAVVAVAPQHDQPDGT